MTFSKFEKNAAGKINNHVSEVDAETLWNDILPHVQKGNNRRRGLIWFFFIGILILFAAIYTLTDGENSDAANENTMLSSIDLIKENNESERLNSIKKETVVISTPETGNENPTEQIAQMHITENTQNQSVEKNSKIKNQQKKYKASNVSQPQFVEPTAIENVLISKSNEPQIILEEEEIDPIIDLKEENPNFEATAIIKNSEAIPIDSEQSKILVDESNLELPLEPQGDSTVQILENPIAEDYKSGNKLKIKYGVGLFGGYSSSFYSLKAKDEMNADYLQLRLGTEEQLETIQMGLEAIAKSEIGVYLKTGLQYSRVARKFSLNSSIETIDSIEGIQKIYVNNNTNDTIYIYGQVPVTKTTTYNKITYNYFHLIDVPILLGYAYKNENWSFGVEAGALINISTKTKGEIMGSENEIYDIKEDGLKWYKDNVGVSFTASVSAAYHLNENFQIYLAPTARLESVFSTDANPIEQKHGSLGVNIGARYLIGY